MKVNLTGFFLATLLGSTAIVSTAFAQAEDAEADTDAPAEAEAIPSPLPEEGTAEPAEGEGMADVTADDEQPTAAEQAGAEDSLTTPTQEEAAAAEGATTAPVEGDPSVLPTEPVADPTATTTAEGGTAESEWRTGRATLTPPAVEREGFAMAEPGSVALDQIQGATVYSVEDENIATVEDVVVGPNGDIQYFLMDVGGFLGVGAREVAVGFDEVTILSSEGQDEVRIYLDATQEALESLPEYEGS